MKVIWNIRKVIKKGDYLYAVVPEHPKKTKNNYVLLHRVLVENHLGRLLSSDEIIHHKNKNKHDNSLSNLEITTVAEHSKEHGRLKGRKYVKLKCPHCLDKFEKPYNKTHLTRKQCKATFCSRKCSGLFNRNIQLSKINQLEIQQAFTSNVVEVYRKFAPIPERTSNA